MKIIIVEKKIIKNVFDVKYNDDDDVKIDYDDRLTNFHHDISQLLNRNVICAKRWIHKYVNTNMINFKIEFRRWSKSFAKKTSIQINESC